MKNLLLLVLLAFGGCEMFDGFNQPTGSGGDESTTPEESLTLADLIGGASDVELLTVSTFIWGLDAITSISADAKTISISTGTLPETLYHIENEDDWATYNKTVYTLTLKNIVLKDGIVTGDYDFFMLGFDAVDTGKFSITK